MLNLEDSLIKKLLEGNKITFSSEKNGLFLILTKGKNSEIIKVETINEAFNYVITGQEKKEEDNAMLFSLKSVIEKYNNLTITAVRIRNATKHVNLYKDKPNFEIEISIKTECNSKIRAIHENISACIEEITSIG